MKKHDTLTLPRASCILLYTVTLGCATSVADPTSRKIKPAHPTSQEKQGAPSEPLAPAPAGRTAPYLSRFEQAVLQELNRVRANPPAYAHVLQKRGRYYEGRLLSLPDQVPLVTQEGKKALLEAVQALGSARPAPQLRPSAGMSRAARDHVADVGPKGATGHNGTDGSDTFSRLERYGDWQKEAAENIQYGARSAAEMIQMLLIDDGVPNRGHRQNILNQRYQRAGVACGKHKTYRTICVITFAVGYSE